MKALIAAVRIDPAQFATERAADTGVMDSLRRNGDQPGLRRKVDLRFVGSQERLHALAEAAPELDLAVIQLLDDGRGGHALDLCCHSDTQESTIDRLTRTALQIAAHFGVVYDGWGCVATKA